MPRNKIKNKNTRTKQSQNDTTNQNLNALPTQHIQICLHCIWPMMYWYLTLLSDYISVISCPSVLLVKEIGIPRENQLPGTNQRSTLSHKYCHTSCCSMCRSFSLCPVSCGYWIVCPSYHKTSTYSTFLCMRIHSMMILNHMHIAIMKLTWCNQEHTRRVLPVRFLHMPINLPSFPFQY